MYKAFLYFVNLYLSSMKLSQQKEISYRPQVKLLISEEKKAIKYFLFDMTIN